MEVEMISRASNSSRSSSYSPPENKSKPSSRYKGVVPQANGNWGAQIYANHHRIWLGTFKTEGLAAAAYDSAATKLRHGNAADSHRNFPLDDVTLHEANFQEHYTLEQVLNMIKDGSYQTKFCDFILSLRASDGSQHSGGDNGYGRRCNKEGYYCKELFRKELTPSDVGKLNRLVIPKRYALKFFNPSELEGQGQGQDDISGGEVVQDGGDVGDLEITFLDKSMRDWKFRYCYWQSSSSFVFTRGWNNFVKVNSLNAKDIVVFYMCELREKGEGNGNEVVKKFYMIDIMGFNASEEVKEEVSSRKRGVEEDEEEEEDGDAIEGTLRIEDTLRKKGRVEVEVEGEGETRVENERKGIRLFGVQILP